MFDEGRAQAVARVLPEILDHLTFNPSHKRFLLLRRFMQRRRWGAQAVGRVLPEILDHLASALETVCQPLPPFMQVPAAQI